MSQNRVEITSKSNSRVPGQLDPIRIGEKIISSKPVVRRIKLSSLDPDPDYT
jgi:hypothetical protein